MPTNMMQIISLMKNGGNPQQMVLSMLEQQTENNPFAANLLQLQLETEMMITLAEMVLGGLSFYSYSHFADGAEMASDMAAMVQVL